MLTLRVTTMHRYTIEIIDHDTLKTQFEVLYDGGWKPCGDPETWNKDEFYNMIYDNYGED